MINRGVIVISLWLRVYLDTPNLKQRLDFLTKSLFIIL